MGILATIRENIKTKIMHPIRVRQAYESAKREEELKLAPLRARRDVGLAYMNESNQKRVELEQKYVPLKHQSSSPQPQPSSSFSDRLSSVLSFGGGGGFSGGGKSSDFSSKLNLIGFGGGGGLSGGGSNFSNKMSSILTTPTTYHKRKYHKRKKK